MTYSDEFAAGLQRATTVREDHLTQESEEPGAQRSAGCGSDEEVIADALQLLADFDNTPLTHMTPLFY